MRSKEDWETQRSPKQETKHLRNKNEHSKKQQEDNGNDREWQNIESHTTHYFIWSQDWYNVWLLLFGSYQPITRQQPPPTWCLIVLSSSVSNLHIKLLVNINNFKILHIDLFGHMNQHCSIINIVRGPNI